MCSCREIVTNASARGGGALTPGAAVVCGGVEVARTSATVKGKVECVQRFLTGLRVHRIFTTPEASPV